MTNVRYSKKFSPGAVEESSRVRLFYKGTHLEAYIEFMGPEENVDWRIGQPAPLPSRLLYRDINTDNPLVPDYRCSKEHALSDMAQTELVLIGPALVQIKRVGGTIVYDGDTFGVKEYGLSGHLEWRNYPGVHVKFRMAECKRISKLIHRR